ncbi:MAG: PTS fructose transporter subunit IIA [Pseudomonadota bacterium]
MAIGLLIITHGDIGQQLVEAARITLDGKLPLKCETLSVGPDCNPEQVNEQANAYIDSLDTGSGVLVLTDIYGSTPSNIANRCGEGTQLKVVAGINLPMLIRILNYAKLELTDIVDKAVSGGHDGIILCEKQ